MEDKSFELLFKLYSEFSEFRKDMNDFRKETNTKFDKVDLRLNKIETTLEHDIKNSIQALHERAAGNTDKLQDNGTQLDNMNGKLDYLVLSVNSQDKRLEVI
jgi:hypothetical protein